jgi:uncharacterized NAD(P)/FAD-binding protein YdhS
LSAALDEGQLIIHFQSGESISVDHFSCLINCTGPETSIEKMSNPVLQELAKRKWITADEVNQGIDIHPEKLRVLGKAPMSIYALGNLCKGTLWESTAIGELRTQANFLHLTHGIYTSRTPLASFFIADSNHHSPFSFSSTKGTLFFFLEIYPFH